MPPRSFAPHWDFGAALELDSDHLRSEIAFPRQCIQQASVGINRAPSLSFPNRYIPIRPCGMAIQDLHPRHDPAIPYPRSFASIQDLAPNRQARNRGLTRVQALQQFAGTRLQRVPRALDAQRIPSLLIVIFDVPAT